MPRRPHPEQHAIIAAYQAGASLLEVSQRFTVAYTTVVRALRRAGVPARPVGHPPTIDPATVIAAYQAGATLRTVSQQLGISYEGVRYLLQQADIPRRPRPGRPDERSAATTLGSRAAGRSRRYSAPGKYVPLVQYLETLPATQRTVTLTIVQIEALVGPLGSLATIPSAYWTSSATARLNWRRAGFTARLDRPGLTVTFTRP